MEGFHLNHFNFNYLPTLGVFEVSYNKRFIQKMIQKGSKDTHHVMKRVWVLKKKARKSRVIPEIQKCSYRPLEREGGRGGRAVGEREGRREGWRKERKIEDLEGIWLSCVSQRHLYKEFKVWYSGKELSSHLT